MENGGYRSFDIVVYNLILFYHGYILFINSFDLYVGRFRQVFVQVEIHTYKNDYG